MKALGSRSSLGGIVLLGVFATVAVAGHLHGDSLALVGEPLTPPSATHPFGTDFLGRDLLARTGRGATTSALVAGASVGLATLIATPIGMVTGWFSHRGAAKVMRWAVELLQVVPPFVLVVVLLGLTSAPDATVFGSRLSPQWRLIMSLAIGFVPYLTRVIHAATAAERSRDHIEGLRLLGVPQREVLVGEVIPNLAPVVAVQMLLALSLSVFAEGGLSYLGMGVPAPAPTLGNLIAEAGTQLLDGAWWYAVIPGLVLVCGITGINLAADAGADHMVGLRAATDASDPTDESDMALPTTSPLEPIQREART